MSEYESGFDHDTADKIVDTVVDSKTGDVLGGLFKLPEPLLTFFTVLQPRVTGWITHVGEEPVRKLTTNMAVAAKIPNAEKVGYVAGRSFAYLFPYVQNMGDLYKTVKIHRENRKMLFNSLAPLLEANKGTAEKGVLGSLTGLLNSGYGNNKMIARAVDMITSNTYRNLSRDATGLVPAMVNNYSTKLRDMHEKAIDSGDTETAAKYEKQMDRINQYGFFASGVAETSLDKFVTHDAMQDIARTSLGKVLALQDYLRSNELDGPKAHPDESAMCDVAQYVEEAFQQFQKEEKRGAIPRRRMHEISRRIAQQILEGDMSALSLVNIIGKKELLNGSGNGLKGAREIEAVLKKETQILPKSSAMNVDEFFAEMNYTIEDVKTHLQSPNKDERALVVILHEEPVLLAAGMKKEDIRALRHHLSGRIMENMLAHITRDLDKQTDSELQERGFDSDAIYFIRDHAGDKESLAHILHDPHRKNEALNIARTVLMSEDSEYWQKMIAQSESGKRARPSAETHDVGR